MNGIETAMKLPLSEREEKESKQLSISLLRLLLNFSSAFSFRFVPDGPSISIADLCNRPYGFFTAFVEMFCYGLWMLSSFGVS